MSELTIEEIKQKEKKKEEQDKYKIQLTKNYKILVNNIYDKNNGPDSCTVIDIIKPYLKQTPYSDEDIKNEKYIVNKDNIFELDDYQYYIYLDISNIYYYVKSYDYDNPYKTHTKLISKEDLEKKYTDTGCFPMPTIHNTIKIYGKKFISFGGKKKSTKKSAKKSSKKSKRTRKTQK